MLTDLQKRTIQSIVNVFETGKATGNYGAVTFSARDVGCLTYGRSQTTLASGGLALLIGEYCNTTGALQAAALLPYLARLASRDRTLDSDAKFTSLLRKAGTDPAMHRVEDQFFDRDYWDPAICAAQRLAIETPLGSAVVYDSFIHGAWARLRDATLARLGLPAVASPPTVASAKPGLPAVASAKPGLPAIASAKPGLPAIASAKPGLPAIAPAKAGERQWVLEYIALRRNWLATHSNPLLRLAVYRMDTFLCLAAAANWDLALPLEAHGVTITEAAIAPRAVSP